MGSATAVEYELEADLKGQDTGIYWRLPCKDAAWSANANRTITGQSNLKLTACLFQYTEGYHLDHYATFTKQQGGLKELGRQAAAKMVGAPEQWTEKTFLDIVRQIQSDTGAEITLLEGCPEQQGTPWLDRG